MTYLILIILILNNISQLTSVKKAYSFDTEAPFSDLEFSITNGIVLSKSYDKQDDFNFEIVNFPFLSLPIL